MNHEQYEIVYSEPGDAQDILNLIAQASDALLAVSLEEIIEWIDKKQSIVVKDENSKVIGHQGMHYWRESDVVEVRSAYVHPGHRKKGLNTEMKTQMIEKAKEKYPDAKISGFTEEASKSRGILGKLGFEEVPYEEVPDEMFDICPDNCFKKTGQPCGCKIYFLLEESKNE